MIKTAYSVSFLFSINIVVWQNVLYFPNDLRIFVHSDVELDDFCEKFVQGKP